MEAPRTAMKVPYGLSDFGKLIQAGHGDQGRRDPIATDCIASLEKA